MRLLRMQRPSTIGTLGHRFLAAGTGLMGWVPGALAYRMRVMAERHIFDRTCYVHHLPPIHRYWSNTHLRPRFEALGFASPEDLFARECIRAIGVRDGRTLRIASLGAGRCEAELDLADRLEREADGGFRIVCIDLSPALLREARRAAVKRGLLHRFEFVCLDLNTWAPDARYDIVIANQCLHHLVALEAVFDRVHEALVDDGVLLVADVIGRNGHRLWPEAEAELAPFFESLPERCRHDRASGTVAARYESHDCSHHGFEGIRAQDVLPLLCERFHFETFAPYGGLVTALMEPRFGFNFDPERAWDRELVDRMAAHEHALLDAGTIKPTHLVASLRKAPVALRSISPALTPHGCIRRAD